MAATDLGKENSRERRAPRNVSRPAAGAVERTIRAGAAAYDRRRDLPALIRIDPFAPPPATADAFRTVVARLERALRAERNRARSGHWAYDLNRHIALRQALLAERERLEELIGGEG